VECSADALPGCWLAVASPSPSATASPIAPNAEPEPFATYFRQVKSDLRTFLAATEMRPQSIAIYGAGAYGAYLLSRAGLPTEALACFIDRNERKRNAPFLDTPVVSPDQIPPSVDTILIGVRPDQVEAVRAMPQLADKRCFALPRWRAPCTA
jgi:hypothetical protein